MAPKTAAANPLTKLGAPAALGVPLDADAANTWMAAVEAAILDTEIAIIGRITVFGHLSLMLPQFWR